MRIDRFTSSRLELFRVSRSRSLKTNGFLATITRAVPRFACGWLIIALALAVGASKPLSAQEAESSVSAEQAIAASSTPDAKSLPYKAVVLENDAIVQSGPDTSFYPTTKLSKGEQVEVYRVDAEQWLAIRPPQDSFSWVAAEHVELTESGTRARVINTPAKTRVGTRYSDAHDIEYTALNKGEILELLGTKMLEDSDTGETRRWFKIAPPSGEFRWIHANLVARLDSNPGDAKAISAQIKTFDLPNEDMQAQAGSQVQAGSALNTNAALRSSSNGAIPTQQIPPNQIPAQGFETYQRTATRAESATNSEFATRTLDTPAHNAKLTGGFRVLSPGESVKQASFESAGSSPLSDSKSVKQREITKSDPGAKRPLGSAVSKRAPNNLTPHINAVTWEAIGDPTNPLAAPEPRAFEDSYAALNILLSRTVLGNVEDWKLDKVVTQADLLKRHAQNRDQLALADQLMAKIQEFQELQKRKLQIETADVVDDVAANKQVSLVSYDQSEIVGTGTRAGIESEPGRLPNYLQDLSQMPAGPSVAARENRSATRVTTRNAAQQRALANRSAVRATPVKKEPIKKAPVMPRRIPRAKSQRQVAAVPELKPAAVLDNSVFDATGTLIQVHSRRTGMPRYALTDSSGRITRFVSTGDGSSLDHLVNSRVGLLGEIGLLAELNKSHVIAVKAVKLQR